MVLAHKPPGWFQRLFYVVFILFEMSLSVVHFTAVTGRFIVGRLEAGGATAGRHTAGFLIAGHITAGRLIISETLLTLAD